ncbi:ATP-binding protein [Blastomonas sp.]|uniref:ATP-binding protein n=1 Tax=Blastomonas sp. TaxID=1909299 RepID=UPI003593429B
MASRNFIPLSCPLGQNGPESVHQAVNTAHLFSQRNDLAASVAARLAILIEEAVTNIYEHGAAGADMSGDLSLSGDDQTIDIVISDSGTAFDPRSSGEIDLPNMERGGGVGLAMIRAWAEIVDYRRDQGMNCLSLRMSV